ncbi:hypothetical protein [Flavobacterium selenitireducens]|uniref:hypothetical protein n=1 Tax=Flavobacterium selenitireducens TaxID=2722704 RepID=UPI00168B475D|nr:hypothetical protein [Flavobacterium selenitireducens]MBD3582390.1 hypothetical protein [Flavobacterium selenitireducens]
MRKSTFIASVFVFALLLMPALAEAQCAMCRAVLQNSDESEQAEAVNNGIIYLMAIPYVLVGVLGFFVYRLYRKRTA